MLHTMIMAGGRGTRFWPASRARMPKQFLPLFGGRPVLSQTLERMDGLVDPAHIIIATNVEQEQAVRACVPSIPPENILFHDGTNQRVERQMALLAENGMMHQTITQLLQDRFKGLNKAISGRIT